MNGISACSFSHAASSESEAMEAKPSPGVGGSQVAKHVRFPETGSATVRQFQGEQPFVDDIAEAVNDPPPVKVEARRSLMRQRMEAGSLGESVPGDVGAVPAQGLRTADVRV